MVRTAPFAPKQVVAHLKGNLVLVQGVVGWGRGMRHIHRRVKGVDIIFWGLSTHPHRLNQAISKHDASPRSFSLCGFLATLGGWLNSGLVAGHGGTRRMISAAL